MTRREAIKELAEWLDGCCGEELEPTRKALRMAVGALKAQMDGDTISRQAAIDAVSYSIELCNKALNSITLGGRDRYAVEVERNSLLKLKDDLKLLPPAQPEPKWIPVSERLPEEGERVLATHLGGVNPNRQVIEHIYQCGKFTCGWDMDMNVDSPTFGQRYMGDVIAWMPLPEPYKEKTDG